MTVAKEIGLAEGKETPRLFLTQIRPAASALRKVDKNSAKFLEMVPSVAKMGILNPIPGQFKTDEETGEEYFQITDGLHRFSCAVECGMEMVPIAPVVLDEVETLIAQVHANYAKVDTKKTEFSRQLVRILQKVKTMTESELADMTGFSLGFIRERLKLNKIADESILALIDSGKISMQNAYALASLPVEEHEAWKEDAITQPPQAYLASVKAKNKAIKEAKKQGRAEDPEFPGAKARLRTLKELKEVVEDVTPVMQFVEEGMSVEAIIEATINYVMTMDPQSIEDQKAKWEANQLHRKETAERRAKDKLQKKAEQAVKKADQSQADAQKALQEAMGEEPTDAMGEEVSTESEAAE